MPTSQNNKLANQLRTKDREIAELKQEVAEYKQDLQQYKHQTEVKELKNKIKELKQESNKRGRLLDEFTEQSDKLMEMCEKRDEQIEELEKLYSEEKSVSIESTRGYIILQKVLHEEIGMSAITQLNHLPKDIGERVHNLRCYVYNTLNDNICDGVKQIRQGFENERSENKS